MTTSKISHRIIRLDQPDPQLLAGLDALHQAFIQGAPPGKFIDFVTRRLQDETMLLILGMVEDTPIGYGLSFDVAEHPFMPEWRRSGYITQVYVTPEYRSQGVGQLILEHTLDWMKNRGIKQVQLNVLVGEAGAEGFWRRHGFVPHRIRMAREL